MCDFLPSPVDLPDMVGCAEGDDGKDTEIVRAPKDEEPFSGLAFKVRSLLPTLFGRALSLAARVLAEQQYHQDIHADGCQETAIPSHSTSDRPACPELPTPVRGHAAS